jgi:hypothetical protein
MIGKRLSAAHVAWMNSNDYRGGSLKAAPTYRVIP